MVVMPMTAFMGVRISWLIRERKSDFARLACSAAVRASLMIFLFLLLQHQLGDVEDIGEHVFAVVIITVQGHVPCLVGRGAVGIHRVLDGA